MNNLTKILLGGTALGALTTAPAMAGDVAGFHITALHAGNVVNKTVFHDPSRTHLTYTYADYSYIPASDLDVKVKGVAWSFGCSETSSKAKITKKAKYGKVSIYTQTFSTACDGAGQVYQGVAYELTNPAGEGRTDSFSSKIIGKYETSGVKYKATLNIGSSVTIGE
jgi:hypothetical protein